MIEVHSAILNEIRWIGVDLNTTGHVAVAADPGSGKIVKPGKSIHHLHNHSIKNCSKLWKEDKLWKFKKFKTKERKSFKTALATISRQIVSFAESLDSGIKSKDYFLPGIRSGNPPHIPLSSHLRTDRFHSPEDG